MCRCLKIAVILLESGYGENAAIKRSCFEGVLSRPRLKLSEKRFKVESERLAPWKNRKSLPAGDRLPAVCPRVLRVPRLDMFHWPRATFIACLMCSRHFESLGTVTPLYPVARPLFVSWLVWKRQVAGGKLRIRKLKLGVDANRIFNERSVCLKLRLNCSVGRCAIFPPN